MGFFCWFIWLVGWFCLVVFFLIRDADMNQGIWAESNAVEFKSQPLTSGDVKSATLAKH